MKPGIRLAVLAIFFYAVQNVVLDRKLVGETADPRLTSVTMMLFIPAMLCMLVLPFFLATWMRGHAIVLPQGNQWGWVFAATACLFIADLCYFSAYASNVSVTAITTTSALLPVFASLVSVATGGKAP